MAKFSKKILCSLLVAIMVLSSVPFVENVDFSFLVSAHVRNESGMCGDKVSYTYNAKKDELTISGTGRMWEFDTENGTFPRFFMYYPKNLVIGSGVTYVDIQDLFQEVTCLSKITVNKNNKYYSSDSNGVLFNKDKTELLLYPASNTRTSYKIPSGVKKIADLAFLGSSQLKSLTLPNSLETIGKRAFSSCYKIANIKIPAGTKTIGEDAFESCEFKKITVDSANKYFSSDSAGVLFNKKKTKLILCPVANTTTAYTVPDSVKTIADCAFAECENLQSVKLGKNVSKIGNSAFGYCQKLKSVTLTNSLLSIGAGAFAGCSNLKNVTLPSKLTTIGASAFLDCDKISSVKIPSSVTTIGNAAFGSCEGLKKITVDKNNKNFSNDSTGVLFNKDKTKLIQYPCGNDKQTYKIPNTVKTIAKRGFQDSLKLNSITIGNNVKTIGAYAFNRCSELTKVTIPNSVKTIGADAFSECSELTNITIPNSVTTIGNSAFYDCDGLTKITIPDSVTTIGKYAFSYCERLQSVSLGKGVTSIGEDAFSSSGLRSIYIPKSVKSIGRLAFGHCGNLTKITVDENNNNYSSDSYGVLFNKAKTELIQYPVGNKRTSYTVPSPVKKIDELTFYKCEFLESVTIAKSVKTISRSAFDGCSKLSSVTAKGSLTNVEFSVFSGTPYFENESNWENGVLYLGNSIISVDPEINSFTMKKGTVSIAGGAFEFCGNLKNITILDSVKTIGANAFAFCGLKSITIGKGVTSIGRMVFYECVDLNDIYYKGTKKDWNKIKIGAENEEISYATIHYQA